jgi:hypothetical protein
MMSTGTTPPNDRADSRSLACACHNDAYFLYLKDVVNRKIKSRLVPPIQNQSSGAGAKQAKAYEQGGEGDFKGGGAEAGCGVSTGQEMVAPIPGVSVDPPLDVA